MCKSHSEGHGTQPIADATAFRLPRTVWPLCYKPVLEPNLETFTFKGHGTIKIRVGKPVDKIVLNAKELEIQEATVTDRNGTSLTGSVTIDPINELATISFAGKLARGKWTLFLRWTGIHNDKLKGFYRSFWTDKEGKRHPIVATQFESTDARRCMPCFDEPEFKAKIEAELIIDENLTAISNTRVVSETIIDDGRRYITKPESVEAELASGADQSLVVGIKQLLKTQPDEPFFNRLRVRRELQQLGLTEPQVDAQLQEHLDRGQFARFDEMVEQIIADRQSDAVTSAPAKAGSPVERTWIHIKDGDKLVGDAIVDTPKSIIAPRTQKPRKKSVKFARTPIKLSSYLFAFVVGEFVSTKPVYVNGIEIRVWTTPGKEHLTEFAVKCSAAATAYYERRNRSKFPGNIINAVAIPDFASGAMENWGCITYRETALLIDLRTASLAELKRVAEVIYHEHDHNDFGNKCTMRWWNGLWLNESFATHGSHQAMHEEVQEGQALAKELAGWKVWEEFALSRGAALRLDSLNSTHPIECPVNHPDEVAELFDLISYEKGCSVLYQIQQFIADNVFRDGVAAYIEKHAFANTETHDLWDALEESCKQHGVDVPVRKIMDAWVFTSGHPVVSVKEGSSSGFIELSQQIFKFLPQGKNKTTWPVPVTMQVKRCDGTIEEKKFVFEAASETHFIGEYEWVKLNAGGSGFYRVRYSQPLLAKLTKNVQKTLSVVERYNLVNDTWSAVRAGITSTPEYLGMVKECADETDPNVWAILNGSLRSLDSILTGDARAAMRQEIRTIAQPALNRLGITPKQGEASQDRELRASLLALLGTVGEDAACRKQALELFDSWKKDKTSIDSNLLPAAVSILAYTGDKARYEEFFNLFKSAKTPQEEQRFLGALTAFRDKDLLDRSIKLMLSDQVRTQDAPFIFAALLRNEVCGKSAWDFMRQNWDKMVAAYPENGVVRMIGGAESLDTVELEAEVREFFAKHPVKQGEMATAQMLEQLSVNVRLRQNEAPKLTSYLAPKPAAVKKEEVTSAPKQ